MDRNHEGWQEMVESTRDGWLKISGFRWRWYNLVAKYLLIVIQDLRNEIAKKNCDVIFLNEQINKMLLDLEIERQHVHDWKERATITNSDGAIAAQIIRERMRSGEMGSVLGARERASSQRIRDLEAEIVFLNEKIKKWNKN